MARPPHDLHPKPDGAGDGGHDSNRQILRFQHRTLLDVHLDVGGDLVRTVAGFAHRIRVESELAHRLVKVHAVLVDGGKRRRVEIAGDGLAADQRCLEPKPFLVSERDHVDGIVVLLAALVQRPKAGDGQHHPERPVVLPRVSNRIEMGAEDEPARAGPPAGEAADHVAHRVEPRGQARFAHPPHDQFGRPCVLRGQVSARELGGVFAAFRELVEPLHDYGSEIHTFSRHPAVGLPRSMVDGQWLSPTSGLFRCPDCQTGRTTGRTTAKASSPPWDTKRAVRSRPR